MPVRERRCLRKVSHWLRREVDCYIALGFCVEPYIFSANRWRAGAQWFEGRWWFRSRCIGGGSTDYNIVRPFARLGLRFMDRFAWLEGYLLHKKRDQHLVIYQLLSSNSLSASWELHGSKLNIRSSNVLMLTECEQLSTQLPNQHLNASFNHQSLLKCQREDMPTYIG